jgi:hypothetical protein
MKIFALTNVDGEVEGTVVESDNGKVVTFWEADTTPQSVAVWDSLEDAIQIHCVLGSRTLDLISVLNYKQY